MKKRENRILLNVVYGVVFLLCVTHFSFPQKDPRIKFKEDSFHFGSIKQGETLTHVFEFTNEGEGMLTIKEVKNSCGCTAALVSAKKINPGAKGELKVTFSSAGYQGRVSKYVYVESDDPKQPQVQLTISADVEVPPQPRINLDTYTSDEGLLLEGEAIKATTTIRNQGELELRVDCSHKDARFFSAGKEVTFPLRIPAGKNVDLEVKIPLQDRKGLVREYILIKSNDPNRQNVSFYVSGYVITKKQLKELFDKYKDILK